MFPDDSLEENSFSNLRFENSPSTPTPPQSPESRTYFSSDCKTYFSNVEMVNPNAVLDESHLTLASKGLNFPFLSLNFSEESLKKECWNPLPDSLTGSSCKSEILNGSFKESSSDSTKAEIRNDCMWTSGYENIKLDRSLSKTNDDASTKFPVSRLRLDSVPSKYSEITDPLDSMIAIINSDDPDSQKIMLNTPADTSDTDADTDTDLDDTCTIAENIHLEHNYHFSNNRISSDFASFQKSNNEQIKGTKKHHINSANYSDGDTTVDEDSENSDSNSDLSRNCTKIANHNHFSFKSSKENVIINTNFKVSDLQMFRKLERKIYNPRKVGRTSKTLRRLENSFSNIKRSSYKPGQMDPEKRKVHNSMERMRRVNLKSDFDHIKKLVPALVERARAPKVMILRSAVEFVCKLKKDIQKMDLEMKLLYNNNILLKQKFDELKKEKGITNIELG